MRQKELSAQVKAVTDKLPHMRLPRQKDVSANAGSKRMATTIEVGYAIAGIESASEELAKALQDLASAQKACEHVWVFVGQLNAFHENNWEVHHRCPVCLLLKTEVRTPICPLCPGDIALTKATDTEAVAKLRKLGSRPISGSYKSYRCPNCKDLHILETRGD